MFMKKLALHWQIIIGIVLGLFVGVALTLAGQTAFSNAWIKPFGQIFINLLKLIAVPLVLISLVKGITSLSDISRLSLLGSRTVAIYLFTTVIAVIIGLVLVNITQPGKGFSEETRKEFSQKYKDTSSKKIDVAQNQKNKGPLQPLVDMFPSNIFSSFTSNRNMLQVIVFAILFSIAIVMLKKKEVNIVVDFFESLNHIIIQMVNIIMMAAPYGVFALIASLIADFAGENSGKILELLSALGFYSITVFIGLVIMTFVFYPTLLKIFTNYSYMKFFQAIAPAQMMAFSTSSSAATLPITMSRTENHLGISKETTSFVLPLGATINMDGTSLYQSVAAVFIAQAYGIDLSLAQQTGIIATATLASVGAAAVPGAGVIMLIIVLEQAGIPVEGIALILAPDRILDMCRTVVNITGDTTVSTLVEKIVLNKKTN